jgi:hypothetical protein
MNLVLMILMACLSIVEGVNIAQNGANARNVLFCLLFAAFAVRRFLIHQKYAARSEASSTQAPGRPMN